ncbi:sigma-70 family RNA polymerase sigma factor [Maribellus sp. YY47]|nr:sigma-70 family RNA polymerase sigma factor [Maribellus sp. YY47]
MLVRFANNFLMDQNASEDIVQNAFVYLWENRNGLQLKSETAYLFQSVKNSCLNHLRSLKIRDKHQLLYIEAVVKLSEQEAQLDSEIIDEIKRIIDQLPEKMYQIFHKKYVDDFSIKEIAHQLSISENTVKVQLFKGRAAIRQMIGLVSG